jgi:hypothetical protein
MATKNAQLTDPDYQARLEEAYQKLVESLDQRKNRFFDPTWLAAAQAFATPSQTGSAFEALGRVAGAVGKSQEEEFKRNIEENKARFDINKELLTIEQQRKNQAEGLAAIRGEAPTSQPATPELAGALPGPQPAGGALTSAIVPGITSRPLEVGPQGELPPFQPTKNESQPGPELVTRPYQPPPLAAPPPALPPAPAAPTAPLSAPPQAQVSPAQEKLILGMTPAGQKIAELAFRQGVPIQDAIKRGQEHDAAIQKRINDAENLRIEQEKLKISRGELGVKEENLGISRSELEVKQRLADDAAAKTRQGNLIRTDDGVVDISGPTPRLVLARGGDTIKYKGKSYPTDPATASAFNNAVLNQDFDKVGEIFANLPKSTDKTGATRVLSTEEREQEKLDEAAEREVKKEVKVQALKAEQKRQEDLVSKIPALREQKNDTKTLIDIFNKKDVQKVLGPTAKPGVRSAIGELVSGGLNVGGYQVAITNFDKAIVQVDAPKEVIDQLNVAGSLLRRAELLNSQTYLKGQGTVTNMERAIVQDINGLVYKDPPNALLFKSQLAYAQANMNERYIKTFQSWRDKNPDGTIEQFNRSKAYDTIENDYSEDLKKIKKSIGLGPMPTEKPKDEAVLTTVRSKLKDYANKAVQ